ncbi:hypothetical protein CHU70_10780 (plasmid) [Corynebacterium sp. LK10]|uniref:hypothetical protein n=1 Tax=Corynebacterium sp. LK10 TaxID=2022656 RepID=UPI0011C93B74|nr:hypothetical protein [Corynebacterium sp. LK10]TXS81745.1 hypothetical protein CHU70_10780 [Corynebacterium sp. LK10]
MPAVNTADIERIRTRLSDYEMTIHHADGLYRHLYFHSTTDPFPGNCSFHVVTWPGHACIHGDWCGAHTIAREADMLKDFLNVDHIDRNYWAEKMSIAGHHQQLTEESQEVCNQWITDRLQEIEKEFVLNDTDRFNIRDEYESCRDGNGILQWEKLQNLGTYVTWEGSEGIHLGIDDAWELDFTVYRHDFLVACEGLRYAAERWAGVNGGAGLS